MLMKKKLSLLMVAFLSVMAFAATLTWKAPDTASEVTLDFTAEAQGYTNGQAVESLSVDDVTASFAKGSSSNAPKYYSTGDALRCYGGNTIALTSEKTITKAVFTFASGEGSNEITADKGTFETDTWTGSENAVTFTIGGSTGHRRIQKIVVTLSGEAAAVAKPVIAGETPFLGTTNVTITCATEGAAIYYTTDGTAPTAESTAYTEPFAINATTTVKAIAVKDADQSEVAEKIFTAMEGTATLAELNALENGATFGYTGEAKVVAKPTANYVYVTDASGAALIYDASGKNTTAAEVGKTIAANWTGKVSIYNQLTELVPDAALVMKDGEAVAVAYPEVAATDMIAENVNRVVTLKGITGYVVDGKNITITIGETPVVGYNQFGLEIAAAEEGKTYEMVGAISRYKETIQFQPISIARTPEVVDVTVDAADITGDITAALNAKTTSITEAGDIVGNITINLAAGAYTVSAPIVAGGNVVINGNGATIDASALAGPFVQMSTEPTADFLPKYDGTGNTDYYGVNVEIRGVNVNGLKNSIFYDNNTKYCVVDFKIDNCVFALATEEVKNEALISFQSGGAKDFTITNSTVYGNGAVAKYFLRYNNSARLDRYGFNKDEAFETFTYTNNTFVNLLKSDGQWANYSGMAGQKYTAFDIKKNIWMNCGENAVPRRLLGGRAASSYTNCVFDKNTYAHVDAEGTVVFEKEGTDAVKEDGETKEATYDVSETALLTDPNFKDAANGDFAVEASTAQAENQTGDQRWGTWEPTPVDINITPEAGADIAVALATAKAGVAKVGNIKIELAAKAAYTISAPLEAPADIKIYGNEATIDASALAGPFVQMSTEPTAEFLPKYDGTGNTDYYGVNVEIRGVNVNGLKNSIFYDNNTKYCVVDFKIDNCVFALATEEVKNEALISFQSGGAKDFTITNSTVYGNGAVAKYFLRYNNSARLDRYGFNKDEAFETFTYTNNTFVNLLKSDGQWANYSGMAGQKYTAFDIKKNIWMNCGENAVPRRLLGGRAASSYTNCVFDKNTYAHVDAEGTVVFEKEGTDAVKEDGETKEATYDVSETALLTDPNFKDAANGDFAVEASTAQAENQTGDQRWGTWAAPKFYIIGGPKEWKLDDMTEMTFNAETQAYEYEYAPTTTAYFAFADKQFTAEEAAAEGSWAVFNSTNRYSLGRASDTDPNVEVSPSETALTLIKGVEGTIKLNPGTYKISVAKDFSTVTISGEATPETPAKYYLVGSMTGWEVSEDYELTPDNENEGQYKITKDFAANDAFKIVKGNKEAWYPEGMGNDYTITTASNYTVYFNPAGGVEGWYAGFFNVVDNNPSGINAVKADALKDAQIYTISGQRVDKAQKGLYIVNGRKVVIK